MVLVRIARQVELGLGQQLVKETHGGRKLLLVRHAITGAIYASDAHCFHQGQELTGGDIEDVGGHTCIVCPAHRYRIDLVNGHKIDSDLCGTICPSADQKQRVYTVHCDPEFIFLDIPEVALPPLPSDLYNQFYSKQQAQGVFEMEQQGYGLKHATNQSFGLPPPTPLQPYAGFEARPLISVTTTTSNINNDPPPLQLSQESVVSSAPAPSNKSIKFPVKKVDPPHVARRKAATAAIMKRSYAPPTASPSLLIQKQKSGQQTLFESWNLPKTATKGGNDAMDVS